jgi:hypothetical protein
MTLYDIQLTLDPNSKGYRPKFFKSLPWQAQVVLVTDFLEQGSTMAEVQQVLKVGERWIHNCIKVRLALQNKPEWNCKHARSLQQAVTTVNLKRGQERRASMEKKASEAPSSPRAIFG